MTQGSNWCKVNAAAPFQAAQMLQCQWKQPVSSTQTCGYWVLCCCINDIMFSSHSLTSHAEGSTSGKSDETLQQATHHQRSLMPHLRCTKLPEFGAKIRSIWKLERKTRRPFLCKLKSVQNSAETESPGSDRGAVRHASCPQTHLKGRAARWQACVNEWIPPRSAALGPAAGATSASRARSHQATLIRSRVRPSPWPSPGSTLRWVYCCYGLKRSR